MKAKLTLTLLGLGCLLFWNWLIPLQNIATFILTLVSYSALGYAMRRYQKQQHYLFLAPLLVYALINLSTYIPLLKFADVLYFRMVSPLFEIFGRYLPFIIVEPAFLPILYILLCYLALVLPKPFFNQQRQ